MRGLPPRVIGPVLMRSILERASHSSAIVSLSLSRFSPATFLGRGDSVLRKRGGKDSCRLALSLRPKLGRLTYPGRRPMQNVGDWRNYENCRDDGLVAGSCGRECADTRCRPPAAGKRWANHDAG